MGFGSRTEGASSAAVPRCVAVGNRVLASGQLFANRGAGFEKTDWRASPCDCPTVPARGNFPDQIGACAHKFSDQKKCRAHGVAIEQFEKLGSDGRVWAIVKGERDLPRGRRVPHGGAEQFGRGSDSTPRRDSGSGRCASSHGYRPGVQLVTAFDFRTVSPHVPVRADANYEHDLFSCDVTSGTVL